MASSSDHAPLLPGSLRARLEAWLCGMLGYALLAVCLAASASLLTWSAGDPSIIRTAEGPARNALGVAGANFSDLAMRLFGLAAIVIILPPAFWALQLITRRHLEDARVKAMLTPVSVILFACAASALPIASMWPLPYGLGGLIGDQVLKSLSGLFLAVGPDWASVVAGACCFVGGMVLLTGSLGMSLQDLRLIFQTRRPRVEGLGSMGRWFGRTFERGGADPAFVRREPTLDRPSGPVAGLDAPFPIEPAFDYVPRPRQVPDRSTPTTSKRVALRRPVRDPGRDPEFERNTEAGSRVMAERFAPSRDEEPVGGQGGGPGLHQRRAPGPAGTPVQGGGGSPAQRRPVWPGSVPAPGEADVPSAEPYYAPGRSAGDELYGRAVAVVRADRKASAEYLQQRLGIGYMRAANLIDRMEQEGLVGAVHNGVRPILGPSRPRTV